MYMDYNLYDNDYTKGREAVELYWSKISEGYWNKVTINKNKIILDLFQLSSPVQPLRKLFFIDSKMNCMGIKIVN